MQIGKGWKRDICSCFLCTEPWGNSRGLLPSSWRWRGCWAPSACCLCPAPGHQHHARRILCTELGPGFFFFFLEYFIWFLAYILHDLPLIINFINQCVFRPQIPLSIIWLVPGNSAQCYVAAWMGWEIGGEWIHAYVWLSPLKLSQHC